MSLVSIGLPPPPNRSLGFFLTLVGRIPSFRSVALIAASDFPTRSPLRFSPFLSLPSQTNIISCLVAAFAAITVPPTVY